MRIRYTPRAVSDLIEICDFLRERNPVAARAVENRIRASIDTLLQFPSGGRTLEQRPDVRVMPVLRYPYLVFYSVLGEELRVLHIRHGARQPISGGDV
jgi:plasmid stabilization system protein ParE